MVQTVLTNERAATGSDASMASVTTAANATTEAATDAVTEKNSGKTTEKASTEAAKTDKNDKASTTEKSSEKTTEKAAKGDKTTEKSTEKATTDKTSSDDGDKKTPAIDTGGSSAPVKRPTKYKQVDTRKSRNSCYRDVTQIALETQYPYIKVDKSYFDDALFIGDSRVEGLALYSGLDNATFAYMEGLTTFGLMSEKIAANGTETLTQLLSENTYKKIYIMLGINEAGYDTDSYASTYMDAISQIQGMQPDAIVFMMGCMHVSSDYSDTHDIVNNDNIDDKNGAIAAYADGIKLFYLDMNTAVDDGKGGLIKDYTWDDIHLQAQYYSVWEEYIYEHGLKDDAFNF